MKEDLRGAETWPDGDGTAGENEVMEMQSCTVVWMCAHARTRTHVDLALRLPSVNLIHNLK